MSLVLNVKSQDAKGSKLPSLGTMQMSCLKRVNFMGSCYYFLFFLENILVFEIMTPGIPG